MGAEQDDPYAARRAEMERIFHSLPAAGTPGYWQRIESEILETALPLEVLAHCVCKCAQADDLRSARRVFTVILGRIQTSVQSRLHAAARRSTSREKAELVRDLEQECYAQLWKELIDPEPTFFREHFMHALKRLISHVQHSYMEREGLWKRPHVETPRRVPVSQQDSLDEPIAPGGPLTYSQSAADPAAMAAFAQVDRETDIEALVATLQPEDRVLLYDLFWRGMTQEQVAEHLHITDRTVRNRLMRILEQLRKDYFGSEEGERGE